ncbi:hypothetical protein Gasu2_28290 [Galdieria sulphuraria]|uniref:Small ubiquitin-related modifier 2 n=1 Tax=Galdieria sulphuraria TaxID=130081 RepID=M2VZ32_GALSU|nr:small ubiquitin-related modifier 2 [Galdieria sulphuraria]EME28576.1 small ubiquitin-related modifier 2 [Galdieria sulphuraria]GJD08534.1 hypothetical protein Gasu2_28290 [Galdieria sulphuraria]|eukprot:XP_005705096.1 small ubiquitin-related modifier 2 [Galdieria sulphuraria]
MGIPLTYHGELQAPKKGAQLYVELWVTDEFGNRARFKLKRRCPLWVLFEAYCSRRKLTGDMKFLFAGREVSPLDTPEVLNMRDVDSLVALPQHCLVV